MSMAAAILRIVLVTDLNAIAIAAKSVATAYNVLEDASRACLDAYDIAPNPAPAEPEPDWPLATMPEYSTTRTEGPTIHLGYRGVRWPTGFV